MTWAEVYRLVDDQGHRRSPFASVVGSAEHARGCCHTVCLLCRRTATVRMADGEPALVCGAAVDERCDHRHQTPEQLEAAMAGLRFHWREP